MELLLFPRHPSLPLPYYFFSFFFFFNLILFFLTMRSYKTIPWLHNTCLMVFGQMQSTVLETVGKKLHVPKYLGALDARVDPFCHLPTSLVIRLHSSIAFVLGTTEIPPQQKPFLVLRFNFSGCWRMTAKPQRSFLSVNKLSWGLEHWGKENITFTGCWASPILPTILPEHQRRRGVSWRRLSMKGMFSVLLLPSMQTDQTHCLVMLSLWN